MSLIYLHNVDIDSKFCNHSSFGYLCFHSTGCIVGRNRVINCLIPKFRQVSTKTSDLLHSFTILVLFLLPFLSVCSDTGFTTFQLPSSPTAARTVRLDQELQNHLKRTVKFGTNRSLSRAQRQALKVVDHRHLVRLSL